MLNKIKLRAVVDRVTFHNEVNGWSVLKVLAYDYPGQAITVIVYQTKVFAGATMEFEGEWVRHPKHGQQFKAHDAIEKKPSDIAALEKYIGSGLISGVGPKTAKKIVKFFGTDTLDIFEQNISRLVEVGGIAQKKLFKIQNSWEEHKEIRNVMLFLQSHGISTLFAVKIFKTYGQKAIDVVSDNPYQLSRDIYGIGFKSADSIAKSLGVEQTSPIRLKAAIRHVLAAAREQGHCYLSADQVIKNVETLLSLNVGDLLHPLLDNLEQVQEIKVKHKDHSKCYYSRTLFYDENFVIEWFGKRMRKSWNVDQNRIANWIESFNSGQKNPLSKEQCIAVQEIAASGYSILTGGPGCGKTTTTKTLVKLLKAMNKKLLLAAPTGRASQRMTEVIEVEAKTIHRLLEWAPHEAKFKKNEDNPLDSDFLIIDEASMLDISLCASLLRAVSDNTQVVLIGDPDQLPSVGPGNVLKDLIDSQVVPTFKLTQVFRQASESLIINYAHQINKGIVPDPSSPFRYPKIWKEAVDVLFIDCEEATIQDTKFLKRIKDSLGATELSSYFESIEIENSQNLEFSDYFELPKKYKHVDFQKLKNAQTEIEKLMIVLKKVNPWSCLYWGKTGTDMIEQLYSKIIPKYDGVECEIQVLTPMLRGSMGAIKLNEQIQQFHNTYSASRPQIRVGGRILRLGDRVIQRRNNYDLNVFNGDIGYICSVNPIDMRVEVIFSLGSKEQKIWYEKENLIDLDLAYAITIHKSQGSEFDCVIIPIFTQHFTMLFRNLIYTALTRAKKRVVFVGSRQALAMAIKKITTENRQTLLKEGLISTNS